MAVHRFFLCFFLLLLYSLAGFCQQTPLAPPAEADLSKQAFVFEKLITKLRFESDGTGERDFTARVKVQSEAGVQALGLVRLGYDTASEKLTIDHVQVTKPDGRVITANTDSVQDLAAEIQQIAPYYTDAREKHINVPGLRPGDTLEYAIHTKIFAPIIPGQFFFEYSFDDTMPVLDEELEVDLPADRKVLHVAPATSEAVATANGRTKYFWKRKNLPKDADNAVEDEEEQSPDIRFSTFQTWSELAKWYEGLEASRAEPNAAVRKKAAELTAGLSTDTAKAQAIYSYVSTNVRYLGLSFGVGRFQPHHAGDVLANEYGDCKDKYTLMASLLESVGIKAEPILINSGRKLDPEIPSPMQFNHLIGVINLASGPVYADPTTEVAPMGYLLRPLRGKHALLAGATEGKLIKTPEQASSPTRDNVVIEAKINSAGDLDAEATHHAEGDVELTYRLVLRHSAESQWPAVLKGMLAASGLEADVSNVTVQNLSDMSKPFELKYHVAKKQFADLKSTTSIKLPILGFALRPAATPEQKKGPIRLGKQELVHRLRLEVPTGFMIVMPTYENKVEDFVEYHSTYKITNKNVMTVERVYKVTKDEVPRARYTDYNRVYDRANADGEQTVYLTAVPGSEMSAKLQKESKALETGSDKDLAAVSAEKLYNDGVAALKLGNMQQGLSLLQKTVAKDAKYPGAWAALGSLYMMRRTLDRDAAQKAIAAFKKELENDPKNDHGVWQQLAMAYFMAGKFGEAADAISKQAELTPGDSNLRSMQAEMLLRAGRPAEAVAPLEAEIQAKPDEKYLQLSLAKAYLLSGNQERGKAMVEQLITGAQSPMAHASIAEMLSESADHLDLAEEEAQKALASAYEFLQSNHIRVNAPTDLERCWKLGNIWQSAGAVYLKRGDLARAQSYLEAAWAWSQQFRAGELLSTVYAQQDKKIDAARTLAQALSMTPMNYPSAQARLAEYVGDEKRAAQSISQHRLDMQQARTRDIPNPQKISGSAEVYFLVGPGSKIEEVEFHEGDKKVSALMAQLKKARLELPFPDEQPIYVLRSGILSCYSLSPTCKFVLTPPPTVTMFRYDEF